MPPSSLYWIQKSASSSSNAAGNRSSAASPCGKPPLASALRVPPSNPTPIVPAPAASDARRNERRLKGRRLGLTLFCKLSCEERFSFLRESFVVGSLIVFMPVELQQT